MAAVDQGAYSAMCDLLLSPVAELRLKGLVALRAMAPSRPDEVLKFLSDRVAEARTTQDPLLLDATFLVFAALPQPLGQPVVERYLEDLNEAVRAAAVSALSFWGEWPDGTLQKLARDPSELVQAGLITVLHHLEDSPDKQAAVEALRNSSNPHLDGLLEDLLSAPREPVTVVEDSPLDEEGILRLLHERAPSPLQVRRLGQALEQDHGFCLGLLRQGLEAPGGALVVRLLSDTCCDTGVSTLLGVWSRYLERPDGFSTQGLTLQILGVLEGHSKDPFLEPLREFVAACATAQDCTSGRELVAWSCTQQVRVAAVSLWNPQSLEGHSLASEAHQWLLSLAGIGAGLEEVTLFGLSSITAGLTSIGSEIQADCPRPERDLLLAVVESWQQIVDRETEALMGGGATA